MEEAPEQPKSNQEVGRIWKLGGSTVESPSREPLGVVFPFRIWLNLVCIDHDHGFNAFFLFF